MSTKQYDMAEQLQTAGEQIAAAGKKFSENMKLRQPGLTRSPYKITDEAHLYELPLGAIVVDEADNAARKCAVDDGTPDHPTAEETIWHVADCWDESLGTGEISLPAVVAWPAGWRPAAALEAIA